MDRQIARRAVQGFVNQLAQIAGSGKALKNEMSKCGVHSAMSVQPAMMEGLEQRLVLAADLAFGTVSVGNLRALASGGGTLSGSATIVNLGNEASGTFTYTAALSLDGTVGNDDDVLITAQPVTLESIAAGRNFRLNLNTLTIPAGLEPGAYRLVLRLDPSNAVAENSDTNNSFVSPNQSIVLNGASTNSNLSIRVTSRAVTITPDGRVPITTVISNRGPAINTPFTVTWTLSTDRIGGNAGDIELDSQVINSIAANGSQTIEIDALLPVGTDIGQYFLIATVDGPDLGVVDESNEGDNTFVSSSPLVRVILPDVSATFSTRSATVAPGQTITGSLTVRNLAATATGSAFRVAVYLVPNADSTGTQDLRIGSFDIPALAANGTFTLSNVAITLPLSAPAFTNGVLTRVNPGTYSLAVVADDADEIDEGGSGEENNITTVSRVTITVPARGNDTAGTIDLTVGMRNATGSFVPGQSINVEAILSSLGNTFLQNGATVRFFLSSDNTLGETDLQLGSINVLGPIAPGSLLLTPSLTVPAAAQSGRYFILAQVDPANAIAETSETNNVSSTATAAITVVRPSVSVRPVATSVNEANGNSARFTVTRTGARTEALTVNFTLGGTATGGSDFTAPTNLSVTIPAGSASAVVEIPVLGDAIGEGNETIALSLAAGSGYSVASSGNTATVTIVDSASVVSVRAVRPSVNEGAPNATAGFTFTRTGDRTNALVVRFTLGGGAVLEDDFTLPSNVTSVNGEEDTYQITIPAGAASVTASFAIENDDSAETGESLIATIVANATNQYSIAGGAGGTATVTIVDNEPTVTVTATDRTASEPVGTRVDTGSWTFTRSGGNNTQALVVGFFLTGSAEFGDDADFVLSNNAVPVEGESGSFTVTIPAGQTRAVVTLTARGDSLGEGPELATVTLIGAPTYNTTDQNEATITILDSAPRVSVAVTDGSVTESSTATPLALGNTGRFTFTRTGDLSASLTVAVDIESSGSYGADGDYLVIINGNSVPASSLPTSVTFAAGSRTATIDVVGLTDSEVEGPDIVSVLIDEGNESYVVEEETAFRSLFIEDNAVNVSVRLIDGVAAETSSNQAANNAIVEFRRTGATTNALVVRFAADGVGEDLQFVTTGGGATVTPVAGESGLFDVTIPAGSATVRVVIAAVNDADGEDAELFGVQVVTTETYSAAVPPAGDVVIRVTDNDLPTVRLSVDDTNIGESEGGTTVRITREGGNTARPLLVQLNVLGTATNGTDYELFPIAVTIPAGQNSVDIPLNVIDDSVLEDDETIQISIATNEDSPYQVDGEGVSVEILDNELPVVRIEATDPSAAETSGAANGGAFTLRRNGDLTAELTVTVTITGTATNGTDYQTLTTTQTFPAGLAAIIVPVTILNDNDIDPNETVIMTVVNGSGYTASTVQGTATVTITDDDASTVSITASDASAAENAAPANGGTFTVTRDGGDQTGALTVSLIITGTATGGSDYTTIATTVVIPANESSVTIPVSVLNDALTEGNETVIVTLASSSTYAVGENASATVTISDDDVPAIAIAGTRSAIENGSAANRTGQFTVTRSGGDLTQAVTVRYLVSGTATQGTDYQTLTGEIVIPAGQTSAVLTITAIDDSIIDPNETVQITLRSSLTGAYTLSETNSAAIGITDDDGSVVTIAATDAAAGEVTAPGTANSGLFTLTRTGGNIADSLTVTITIGGSATNGTDYQTLSTTVTFAPGSATATLAITVLDDDVTEAPEAVEVEIVQPEQGGYTAGSQRTATVNIADNDVAEVRIEANDPAAGEVTGGTANGGQFTLRRLGDLSQALTVNITLSGTATESSDFETILRTVTFAAGSATATLSINVIDDSVVEFGETVIVTIAPAGGESGNYTVASNNSATVTITDNEPPQVSVATTDPNAAEVAAGGEANGGLFTFTRVGGNLAEALSITIAISGTATNGVDYSTLTTVVTFAAGQTTATLPVNVIDDGGFDASETVTVTIQAPGNGSYTVGSSNTGTVTIADDEQAVDVAMSVTADPQTFTVGDTTNITWTESFTTLSGPEVVGRLITVLSANDIFGDGDDVLLNQINGIESNGVRPNVSLPLPAVGAGTYFILANFEVTSFGVVDSNLANNVGSTGTALITVNPA